MGAEVNWFSETQTVTAIRGTDIVSTTIGGDILYRNADVFILDVPSQIINGRTLVPARAVAEAFGAAVEWDGYTQTVIITDTYKYNTSMNDTLHTETSVETQLPAPTAVPTDIHTPSVSGSSNTTSAPQTHVVVEAPADTIGTTVWIGETGTKYHSKDCRTLRGNKYEITLDEAKAQGRTPCGVCY